MSKNEIIDRLEKQIKGAINQIKNGKSIPKETNIGKLLKHLEPLDQALHEKLVKEYKIVFANWKNNNGK